MTCTTRCPASSVVRYELRGGMLRLQKKGRCSLPTALRTISREQCKNCVGGCYTRSACSSTGIVRIGKHFNRLSSILLLSPTLCLCTHQKTSRRCAEEDVFDRLQYNAFAALRTTLASEDTQSIELAPWTSRTFASCRSARRKSAIWLPDSSAPAVGTTALDGISGEEAVHAWYEAAVAVTGRSLP